MSSGIDPATHRPLHEQQAKTTTPLIKGEEKVVEFEGREEGKKSCSSISTEEMSAWLRRRPEEESKQWRCPDLNLELCMSPPSHRQQESVKSEELSLCFDCRLGVNKSSECNCGGGFLCLSSRVLDYRRLESN